MDRWECILRRICRMIGEDSDLRIEKRSEERTSWTSFPWVVDIYDSSTEVEPTRFVDRTRQKAVLQAISHYSVVMNLLSEVEYDTIFLFLLPDFLLNPGVYEELDMALSARGF